MKQKCGSKKLSRLLDGYKDCDIQIADKTGLFVNVYQRERQCSKNSLVMVINISKKELVLLCTNKDFSDKRVPTVIDKSARPRCFKNIKKLPVVYSLNAEAQMKNIFSKFLHIFDRTIEVQNRKILFIDNCSVHPPDM